MKQRYPSLTQQSSRFARDMTRQLNELQGAVHRLRSQPAGLRGALYAPQIRAVRSRTKMTRTKASLFDSMATQSIGSVLGQSLVSEIGFGESGSFYDSSAQLAERYLVLSLRAGRIR